MHICFTCIYLVVKLKLYIHYIYTHVITECTDLILTNAKEKKREWKTKLTAMEVDNLCSYRDALVAQGVFFNMTLRESEANHNSVIKEVSRIALLYMHIHVCKKKFMYKY